MQRKLIRDQADAQAIRNGRPSGLMAHIIRTVSIKAGCDENAITVGIAAVSASLAVATVFIWALQPISGTPRAMRAKDLKSQGMQRTQPSASRNISVNRRKALAAAD